jgi:hypothetical protein
VPVGFTGPGGTALAVGCGAGPSLGSTVAEADDVGSPLSLGVGVGVGVRLGVGDGENETLGGPLEAGGPAGTGWSVCGAGGSPSGHPEVGDPEPAGVGVAETVGV